MKRISYIIIFLSIGLTSFANNLSVRNGVIANNKIIFEISWDNSWNFSSSGGSSDAVWLFLKGKEPDGIWTHILLSPDINCHTTESNILELELPDDCKGIFIQQKDGGAGKIDFSKIGITIDGTLSMYSEVRIFVIEMVHILEGAFYLGDSASISSFCDSQSKPYLINDEKEITSSELRLYNPNKEFVPSQIPDFIPETFPKGYKGFYCMKYEISQIQYAEFLNTLSYSQQKTRTSYAPSSAIGTMVMVNSVQPDSSYRNSIAISRSGIDNQISALYGCDGNQNGLFDEGEDALNRAMNFLSWGDLSAYLDWACLRPLTEFEFEKICRGALQEPVSGEYAWGTSFVTDADHSINDGTIFETVNDVVPPGYGLANHGNIITISGWGLRGPLRTGFAAGTNSTRLTSGSSYYGVMELSGNVWEMFVMAGDEGEQFSGNPGDGTLSETGDANQEGWGSPETANGVIYRGGAWNSTVSGSIGSWCDMAVSDRFYSHLRPVARRNTTGGRGGR